MDAGAAGGDLLRLIAGARALGETDGAGNPIVSDNDDAGLAGALAKLDENWKHAKTQLGINNPQPYATWFSLRHGLFRILPNELGDNVSESTTQIGSTQYVRDNAFWELRDDIGTLVHNAITAIGDITIDIFDCLV